MATKRKFDLVPKDEAERAGKQRSADPLEERPEKPPAWVKKLVSGTPTRSGFYKSSVPPPEVASDTPWPTIVNPELVVTRVNRGVYIRIKDSDEPERPVEANKLTPREIEVLEHVREGFSNKLIGHMLGISERTVKSHLTFIMTKLNARDRTHAVVQAARFGIIDV